jgi:hypothetical protein
MLRKHATFRRMGKSGQDAKSAGSFEQSPATKTTNRTCVSRDARCFERGTEPEADGSRDLLAGGRGMAGPPRKACK